MIVNSGHPDLPEIPKCHQKAFPKALSRRQGLRFVERMLERYIDNERGLIFHCTDDSVRIQSYCGGIITAESGLLGAVSCITQSAFGTFIISILTRPWLILHPENIKRIPLLIKNLFIKLRLIRRNSLHSWVLVVIGVNPSQQGRGIGSMLLKEFENLVKRTPKVRIIILSVKTSNLPALKAYRKNGWLIAEENDDVKLLKKHL